MTDVIVDTSGQRRLLVEVDAAALSAAHGRKLQQYGYFPLKFILVFASPAAAQQGAQAAVAVSTSPAFVVRASHTP